MKNCFDQLFVKVQPKEVYEHFYRFKRKSEAASLICRCEMYEQTLPKQKYKSVLLGKAVTFT